MTPLYVFHQQSLLGTLSQDDRGALRFEYAREWLDTPGAFAISLQLPLREQPFENEADAFFSNLLPEGNVRTELCRRLGISEGNDFALLAAIGGECAGALSIQATPVAEDPGEHRYRELKAAEIAKLVASGGVMAAIDGRAGLRLSLAGAQDKLPVKLEGARILVPIGSAPSTHILKFASRTFKHLPANEVFTLMLARRLGLPTATAELRNVARGGAAADERGSIALIERYDRRVGERGIDRIHQEDLCQALARRAIHKYEKEGGPGFADCYRVIAEHSSDPLTDAGRLVRWLIFNALALNADGHAKNLSVIHHGTMTLAPFYDLVCTRAYDWLDRSQAMGIGGIWDPTNLRRSNWEALADEIGARRRFVTELVEELAERFPGAIDATRGDFIDRFGASPALQLITPRMKRQAARIRKQIEPG